MRFENQPESADVEDRRGMGQAPRLGGIRFGRGGLGLGGLLFLIVIAWIAGINPLQLLDGTGNSSGGYSSYSEPPPQTAAEAQLATFVKQVLATTESAGP